MTNLGKIYYSLKNDSYIGTINDDTSITDEKTNNIFKTAFDWIKYIEQINKITIICKTSHEFMKKHDSLFFQFEDEEYVVNRSDSPTAQYMN